ncbi:hypothetical protein NDU88_012348 [Pleurodeles waltl]|uniref:Uncharacterized protein n=1 Tax=Pleurodeles waltl TaxID=8319 RepID=A0AAV7R453_PLEWA|nr:hypothetical protein NDU88_012348 [Pleurodeles waltl]
MNDGKHEDKSGGYMMDSVGSEGLEGIQEDHTECRDVEIGAPKMKTWIGNGSEELDGQINVQECSKRGKRVAAYGLTPAEAPELKWSLTSTSNCEETKQGITFKKRPCSLLPRQHFQEPAGLHHRWEWARMHIGATIRTADGQMCKHLGQLPLFNL